MVEPKALGEALLPEGSSGRWARGLTLNAPQLGNYAESERLRVQKRATVGTTDVDGDKDLQLVELTAPEFTQRAILAGHARLIHHNRKVMGETMSKIARASSMPGEALMGLMDKYSGDEPEAQDDEDDSRQTNGEALMNILNNCLGSGMVNIGYTFGQAGLLGGIFGLMFGMTLNRKTVLMVLEANDIIGTDPTTTQVGSKAFGKPGHLILVGAYSAVSFLSMVSYIDAAADSIQGLTSLVFILAGYSKDQMEAAMPSPEKLLISGWLFLMVPLTIPRALKALAVISFLSVLGAVSLTLSLFVCCAKMVISDGVPWSGFRFFPESTANFLNAFPTMCAFYAIQAGSCTVLATMKDSSEKNCRKVSFAGMGGAMTFHAALGVVTYLTFTSGIAGDVINSFGATDPFAVVARVAVLILVVLTYVFMMMPIKFSLIDLIFGRNEALMESTPLQAYGTMVAVNISAVFVAYFVRDITLVLGLMGAVVVPVIAFVLPPAFMIQARHIPEKEGVAPIPYAHPSNYFSVAIVVFGLGLMFFGFRQWLVRAFGGEAK